MKNRYKTLLSYILAFTLFTAVPLFGNGVSANAERGVSVQMPKQVYVCGSPIGIRLDADGLMVTGYTAFLSEKEEYVNPAKSAGIMIGDRILEINGMEMKSAEDLAEALTDAEGRACKARVCRENEELEITLYPAREYETNEYKIGVWVRECSAGIGTVTFYDAESGFFGALGHGINDSTTHALFPSEGGSAYPAVISGVRKGCSGAPGELKGYFREDEGSLGSVFANSEIGVYGVLGEAARQQLGGELLPVDDGTGIHAGAATVICTVGEEGRAAYQAEIERVDVREKGNKGISLKITDEALIGQTGGIVQGMSGSPIVQDGKLVGAVTHVLVNDSTRGYGIVIGNMLRYAVKNGPDLTSQAPEISGMIGGKRHPYEKKPNNGVLAA